MGHSLCNAQRARQDAETVPLNSAMRLHDEETASAALHSKAAQRPSEVVDDKPPRHSWRKAAKRFLQRPRGTLRQKIRSSLRRKMGLSTAAASTATSLTGSLVVGSRESMSEKRQIYFRRLGIGASSQDTQGAPPMLTHPRKAAEVSDTLSSSSEVYRRPGSRRPSKQMPTDSLDSRRPSKRTPTESSESIRPEGFDVVKQIPQRDECIETVSQKERSGFRMSFLSKLSYEKVWVPKPERPRQHSTLIVLDWDDTLLCTSFLLSQNLSSRMVTQRLQCIATAACELLVLAKSLGETVIITNAAGSWVEKSAKEYLPSVLPFLADLEVISARQRYEVHFPDQVARWKAETFLEVQKRRSPESITNFISIGDSSFERDAALGIGKLFPQAVIKIIKFKEDPTPEELAQELRLACDRLRGIVENGRALQVSMERKAAAAAAAPSLAAAP